LVIKFHETKVRTYVFMYCQQFKMRILIGCICFGIVLKEGEEMDTGIAYIIVGVMILVGAIIAGGAIYAGLEKIADAINKQK